MLKFQISIHGLNDGPLTVTFDAALEAMSVLPRMFLEPDGSFVWAGATPEAERWQVDGNLVDRGDVLALVELKGCCPQERLDDILRALGWPEESFAFQLPRRGVTLPEEEFRRLARTEEGAM